MQISDLEVRPLFSCDSEQVSAMDEASGFYLEQWLDDEDFGWGVLHNNKLIGYCSVGGADDVDSEIFDDPDYSCDALLLSDVYVDPAYRGQGVATFMLSQVLNRVEPNDVTIYCCPMYSDLERLYNRVGFISMDSLCHAMKRTPNEAHSTSQSHSGSNWYPV